MRLALRWALLAVPGFSDHFLCEYERALRAEVVAAEADAAAEAEAAAEEALAASMRMPPRVPMPTPMTVPHERRRSSLDVRRGQAEEEEVPASLAEAIGRMHLHLMRLQQEVAQSEQEQDAERVLQELVGLASVAVAAGTAHVLPAIERGND